MQTREPLAHRWCTAGASLVHDPKSGRGGRELVRGPEVLCAVNPCLGLRFLREIGWEGFVVIGSVFLVVTGAEAL